LQKEEDAAAQEEAAEVAEDAEPKVGLPLESWVRVRIGESSCGGPKPTTGHWAIAGLVHHWTKPEPKSCPSYWSPRANVSIIA